MSISLLHHGVSNTLSGWSPLDALVASVVARDYEDRAEYEIQGTRVIAVQYCKVKPSARKLQADSSKDAKDIDVEEFIASQLAASKLYFDPREFWRFRITYRTS
ncbi:hypothetical protein JB92DRAFT_2835198 [Gautieria morchelliformis]|nr:hypothetical protein JB92DRAFT_2835198 [Gautieria morchelliformis]